MQDERQTKGIGETCAALWRRMVNFPYLPAAIMLVVVILTGMFADNQKLRIAEENLRAQVTEQLSLVRSRVEGKINGNVELIQGLVSVIETEPNMSQARFNDLGYRIFQNASQIRNIAAARNMVVNLIYPLRGNEKVLGLDYRNRIKQRDGVERVRATGKIVIVGPLDLVQGGRGIIVRYPVFSQTSPYSGRFWGIVSAVLDLDWLYRDSHIAENRTIDVAIADNSPEGQYGIPFYGDGAVFRSRPVEMTIDLPQEKWRIAAIPKGGWERLPADIWWFRGASIAIGALLLLPMVWAGRLTAERQRNMADLERGKEALRVLSQRLKIAVTSSRTGIWEYDAASGVLVWDERMRNLYGVSATQTVCTYHDWKKVLHPEDCARAEEEFDAVLRSVGAYQSQFRIVTAEGFVRHVRAIGQAYMSPAGTLKIVGVNWDVSDDIRLQQELLEAKRRAEQQNIELEQARLLMEHNSLHDALTKLPNRRYLDQILAQKSAAPNGRATLTVLHIDLDRFKEINDTLGHAAGDEILKHTAEVLRASLRPEDFVARIGGDEFVIISDMPEAGGYYQRLSDRIIEALGQPILFEGHECRAGASIGIAVRTDACERNDELLINADIALYEAKRRGRNRCEFFTDMLRSSVVHTKQTADEILRGLEAGEFLAYYQPQFDAHTLEISGVEALVRWDHPTKGILPPAAFLKIAESLNVVGTLDQIVLEQALVHFNQWTAHDLAIPKVSVNISAQRLHNPHLYERVAALGLRPGSVCFELLESISFDEHDETLIGNIHKLKSLGIEFEIDDFGTGHASIISLLKLTPRRLKIDRQLIKPILSSSTERQLVESIIDIGKACAIGIVAEGVETMEHAAMLRDMGCDHLQGYAFARPMSAADFLDFAHRRAWFAAYEKAAGPPRLQWA